MDSYPLKEIPIGSAVSEIFWYKQTDILLLYYKDFMEFICRRTDLIKIATATRALTAYVLKAFLEKIKYTLIKSNFIFSHFSLPFCKPFVLSKIGKCIFSL